jgi:acyl-CoA synthetase (AMP-forming)/AMP-acid ligase II
MNLIDFFDHSVDRVPRRDCLVFEDQRRTYREVGDLATRIGHGLRAAGVHREAKCAVVSRNHPVAFTAMLGILKAEGTWVPLNPVNAVEENLYIVEQFDVEVLFFQKDSEPFAQLVRERLPKVKHFYCIDGASGLGPAVEPWAATQRNDVICLPWEPEAMCWLRGTGGTTGRPKGVMNTNRNFETTIANFCARLRFDEPPVHLAVAPLSHAAGVLAMVNLALGGTLIIHRGFDAQRTLEAIARHRVSWLYLPPTALYTLLSQPNVREFDYSTLRHFVYGAAPSSQSKLREAIGIFGPVLTQAYGQTEVPTSVTYLGPEDHVDANGAVIDQRLLSCGRPTPFARVALLDDEGKPVPRGEIGEICVQGGLLMKGYYKNPDATAETSKHGWHHTGDLAWQDEEGFIYICDRKKEMIITGGYNVYPLEVEQVVMSHSSVQDCAVVGVPDGKWGEAIKAVIELKPGRSVEPEVIIEMCRERLGPVKTPKSVEFIDELPRSPAGKVLRKSVRSQYWQGQSRNV